MECLPTNITLNKNKYFNSFIFWSFSYVSFDSSRNHIQLYLFFFLFFLNFQNFIFSLCIIFKGPRGKYCREMICFSLFLRSYTFLNALLLWSSTFLSFFPYFIFPIVDLNKAGSIPTYLLTQKKIHGETLHKKWSFPLRISSFFVQWNSKIPKFLKTSISVK